ncbi:Octapeptide-repeat protein T2, partial [Ophiophagus hannah]
TERKKEERERERERKGGREGGREEDRRKDKKEERKEGRKKGRKFSREVWKGRKEERKRKRERKGRREGGRKEGQTLTIVAKRDICSSVQFWPKDDLYLWLTLFESPRLPSEQPQKEAAGDKPAGGCTRTAGLLWLGRIDSVVQLWVNDPLRCCRDLKSGSGWELLEGKTQLGDCWQVEYFCPRLSSCCSQREKEETRLGHETPPPPPKNPLLENVIDDILRCFTESQVTVNYVCQTHDLIRAIRETPTVWGHEMFARKPPSSESIQDPTILLFLLLFLLPFSSSPQIPLPSSPDDVTVNSGKQGHRKPPSSDSTKDPTALLLPSSPFPSSSLQTLLPSSPDDVPWLGPETSSSSFFPSSSSSPLQTLLPSSPDDVPWTPQNGVKKKEKKNNLLPISDSFPPHEFSLRKISCFFDFTIGEVFSSLVKKEGSLSCIRAKEVMEKRMKCMLGGGRRKTAALLLTFEQQVYPGLTNPDTCLVGPFLLAAGKAGKLS